MSIFSEKVKLTDIQLHHDKMSLETVSNNIKWIGYLAVFLIVFPIVVWMYTWTTDAYSSYSKNAERASKIAENLKTKRPIIAGILAPAHMAIGELESSSEPLIAEKARLLRSTHGFLVNVAHQDVSYQFANLKSEAENLEQVARDLLSSVSTYREYVAISDYTKSVRRQHEALVSDAEEKRKNTRFSFVYSDVSVSDFDAFSSMSERYQRDRVDDSLSMLRREERALAESMRLYRRYFKTDWSVAALAADKLTLDKKLGREFDSVFDFTAELERLKQAEREQQEKEAERQRIASQEQQAKEQAERQRIASQEKQAKEQAERQAQIKAERAREEQMRAERAREEQARAKDEQIKAERAREEQRQAERAREEQIKADRVRQEQAKAERARQEQAAKEAERKRQADDARRKAEKAEEVVDGFF